MSNGTAGRPGFSLLPEPPEEAALAGRVRLAASPESPQEVLTALACDADVTVRAAVAMNPATPAGADALLAADADERVRALLARRLAALLPSLGRLSCLHLQDQVLATLAGLVEDEAVRVRAAITEVVASMKEAPRALILRLARDAEVPVSEPVIRLSPLLTEADLLALLAAPPHAATATAIARRAHVSETLSDAVAATADTGAIAALLGNPSAAIREATLDSLVGQAIRHETRNEPWHESLVRRPRLSAPAARALSGIVADHLLAVMGARGDLPAELTHNLRQILAARRTEEAAAGTPLVVARALQQRGELDEPAILEAAERGEARACSAMLAVAAGVALGAVERAIRLRSGKALVSLVWRAGFSMQVAGVLQILLIRLPPDAVMAADANGGFPLTAEEMRWKLEFLTNAGT
jgi:uncharacterized protein (DUF2336 family)